MSQISYPVYRLLKTRPVITEGVSCYLYENLVENEEGDIVSNNKVRFIDDNTLSGKTLAMRRLQLKQIGVKLMTLNRAFFFISDLLKAADAGRWFIDSNGKIFTIAKTTRAKLKFVKVTKLIPIPTGGAIVECEGGVARYKCLFAPTIDISVLHAGLLQYNKGLILYGFYDRKHKDTWRMI